MSEQIHVAILDDHQSIIDGYVLRLGQSPNIKVVATMIFGDELEPTLAKTPTDVLLLDASVPMSEDKPNPYPILHIIPKLLQTYPEMNILVISMFAERGLIRAVMEAGANGYILKDDQAILKELANVVISVANGGVQFSEKALKLFMKQQSMDDTLTPRQLEVLSLCLSYPDALTAELANQMSVSNSTIRNLLSSSYTRLGVHTRAAALEKARQLGLITPPTPHPHA